MSSRILSVSDFHLTAGKNPVTGIWSATEDFFADDIFAGFLAHHSDGAPTTLVINGDLFDFLQVLEMPDAWRADRKQRTRRADDYTYVIESDWRGRRATYHIRNDEIHPRYGLRCTEECTRFLAGRIVEGHETFFTALARFATSGENRVVILKGNHDIQLFWPRVQAELLERIACLAGDRAALVAERVVFKPWFHYEPGRAWIEHGNQYEYTTSFLNFLHPYLPFDYKGISGQIELDLSSLLVRYLTNPLEVINPLADNIRPLMRYWDWVWSQHPLVFIGTIGHAFFFVSKAFLKGCRVRYGASKDALTAVARKNAAMIDDEAARAAASSAGINAEELARHLHEFDNAKAEPTLQRGPFRFLFRMLRNPIKGLLFLLAAQIFLSSGLPIIVDALRRGISLPDWSWLRWIVALLWRASVPEIIVTALVIGVLMVLRHALRRHDPRDDDTLYGNPVATLRERAELIATRLAVKYVSFGHTHYPDTRVFANGSRYFNTGSWMTIVAEQEQLYREMRQLTYLEIDGDDARLRCWNHARGAPDHVVVVDTEAPALADENSLFRLLLARFGR